jgi:hypothetical protein
MRLGFGMDLLFKYVFLYVFCKKCKRRKEKEKDVMPTTKQGSIHMAIIFDSVRVQDELRKPLYKKKPKHCKLRKIK